MNMNRITGLALLLVGCGLSYYGWQSHETGAPTDKAMWLLGLGVLTFATGLYALIFRGAR
jgi:hypothetical protein